MKGSILIFLLCYWPLFKNCGVTGTFSEYRFNHVHAGFDLSTEGKTGWPVKCFEDGYIYMIKVKKHGYGNVIYVKHPEKKLISVYGHLKRFNNELQKVVEKYRILRKTRYPGIILFNDTKIRVKKGQIIGYSGESGEGLPHLHFEVRDFNNNPVDASKYGFDMRFDTFPPVIVSLKAIPEDCFSVINGKHEEVDFKVVKIGKGEYLLKPVVIYGKVRFAVNTYDLAGRGRVGLKKIEFYLNGRLVYHFYPETFSFNSFKESCCVYDFENTSLSPTYFYYNLFKVKGCSLGISSGVQDYRFKEGENTIKIVVEDFHKNRAILTGSFKYMKNSLKKPAVFSPLSVIVNGDIVSASNVNTLIDLGNYAVIPYSQKESNYIYKNLRITVKGFCYEKRLLKVEKTNDCNDFLIPVKGTFYRLSRENEFIKSIEYSLRLKNVDKTLGVYFYDRFKKRWKFIGDNMEKGVNGDIYLSAMYYRVGKIGVFIDNEKPYVSSKGFYFDSMVVIPAGDKGKGIDEDNAFLIKDKKSYKLEYDADRRWLFYYKRLKEGEYTVKVSDLAGNTTIRKVFISKKKGR